MEEITLKPRQYQENILETAKQNNTLVVLPTGLGKTLIALLLSIHQLKKHPTYKILFLAPTRPLVDQHLQTFQEQLPELFADLQIFTGSTPAKQRQKIYQTAEIIFSTPQCIANDVKKGLYSLSDVSLLIMDEAHRCLKNYSYTHVVEAYKNQSENQLLLGMTASPGSEAPKIREICKHLNIQAIESRSRESPDVKPYLQELEFTKVEVPFPQEFIEIKTLLKRIYDSKVDELKKRNLLFGPANKITLLKLQSRLARLASQKDWNAMLGMSATAQAIKISHAIELLETQSLAGLNNYLRGLQQQATEQKSKGVQKLVKTPEFNASIISLQQLLTQKIEHPKIEELAVLTENQLREKPNSKIIIFTQFRDTAATISNRLKLIKNANPSVFIGQAKKKNTNNEKSGLSQKEQKQVIEDFKSNQLNILIATSIGEEGLDIPEVSAVVFYEPIPSAIRKIQRAGRTARLSPGKLIILITKDTRDVAFHYASQAREKKMYKTIDLIREELNNRNKNPALDSFS